MNDISIMAYALVAIAAALWKREARAVVRWLRVKWLLLRVEARAFGDWVFQPEPDGELYNNGCAYVRAEQITGVRYFDGVTELDISSPDMPPPFDPAQPGSVGQEDEPRLRRPKRKRRPKK